MFAVAVIAICALSFSVTLVTLFARGFWSQPNFSLYSASDGTTLRGSYKSFSGKPCSTVLVYKKVIFRCILYPTGTFHDEYWLYILIVCNLFVNSNILVLILSRILGMIYVLNVTSQNSLDFDLLLADLCLSGAKGKCTTAWTTGSALKWKQARLTRQTPRNRCRFLCKHYLLFGSRCD